MVGKFPCQSIVEGRHDFQNRGGVTFGNNDGIPKFSTKELKKREAIKKGKMEMQNVQVLKRLRKELRVVIRESSGDFISYQQMTRVEPEADNVNFQVDIKYFSEGSEAGHDLATDDVDDKSVALTDCLGLTMVLFQKGI